MDKQYKKALEKAKSEHLAVFNDEDFESGFRACWEFIYGRGEAVAWVDVKSTDVGPYEFYPKELLPEGRHQLFAHPAPQPDQPEDVREMVRPTDEEILQAFEIGIKEFNKEEKPGTLRLLDALIRKNGGSV